jgi:hypothetical protein
MPLRDIVNPARDSGGFRKILIPAWPVTVP